MHVLMMSLYSAIAAVVLAAIDPKSETNRQRVKHGLKIFGAFMGIRKLICPGDTKYNGTGCSLSRTCVSASSLGSGNGFGSWLKLMV